MWGGGSINNASSKNNVVCGHSQLWYFTQLHQILMNVALRWIDPGGVVLNNNWNSSRYARAFCGMVTPGEVEGLLPVEVP